MTKKLNPKEILADKFYYSEFCNMWFHDTLSATEWLFLYDHFKAFFSIMPMASEQKRIANSIKKNRYVYCNSSMISTFNPNEILKIKDELLPSVPLDYEDVFGDFVPLLPSTVNLCDFLSDKVKNDEGRFFSDIMRFSDRNLERCHDYIQWIFPLREASLFNFVVPVLTPEVEKQIKDSSDAIANFLNGLDKLLDYYNRTSKWAVMHDHNHLRITRIIKSTFYLLGENKASKVFDIILTRCKNLNFQPDPTTLNYWKLARSGLEPLPKITIPTFNKQYLQEFR